MEYRVIYSLTTMILRGKPMEIILSKDRLIRSDKRQYMICKPVTLKGKKEWQPYMYFTTLELLLRSVPEQMLKESDAKGWAECKAVLTRTYNMIAKRLR